MGDLEVNDYITHSLIINPLRLLVPQEYLKLPFIIVVSKLKF